MPPDLPNEQELTLRKRARRRLVGAMALVLLMVIILPQILQDRALLAQQESIKITMPEMTNTNPDSLAANEFPVNQEQLPQNVAVGSVNEKNDNISPEEVSVKKEQVTALASQSEKKITVKAPEAVKAEVKTPVTSEESFTVQVGVYSDAANVNRLQQQLKQAGFATRTEKVETPKGESLRLKAGNFNSRQEAVAALVKIKEIGLSGIVISNE